MGCSQNFHNSKQVGLVFFLAKIIFTAIQIASFKVFQDFKNI